MESKLLNTDIQQFIKENCTKNITRLALKKNPFPEVEWISILNQVEAKSKAKLKLPTWFATPNILYPSKISVEQTSSEKTAEYKANLISGESLIDLTGGFGVDDYYFAKNIKTVAHCEINNELSQIVKHNFEQLNVSNIECHSGDSLSIIKELNRKWDWIYIDPSRRNEDKGKVFMLQDCLPNVPENLDLLFQYSDAILIKTAPLLDISAGLLELKCVKNIHIIALENEVKELLWELRKDYSGKTTIKTANIIKNKVDTFEFVKDEVVKNLTYAIPERFIYEPNNAIMKSGGFDQIGPHFGLSKLHKHTHLYTNSRLIPFPGRVFRLDRTFPFHKIEMKEYLENGQFNITIRNFPDTVEKIRKKWKIKEGGKQYCFFTTDENNTRVVLICNKA